MISVDSPSLAALPLLTSTCDGQVWRPKGDLSRRPLVHEGHEVWRREPATPSFPFT